MFWFIKAIKLINLLKNMDSFFIVKERKNISNKIFYIYKGMLIYKSNNII